MITPSELYKDYTYDPTIDITILKGDPFVICRWCVDSDIDVNVIGRADVVDEDGWLTTCNYIWRIIDEKNRTMFALKWAK